MKKRELISSLFWLITGFFFTILSATYPIGGFSQPGPGFLPLGLGVLLVLFSVALLIRTLKLPVDIEKQAPLFPAQGKKVVLAVTVLIVAILLFETAGYLLTLLLLGFLLTSLTGWMSWRDSLIFAVLSVLGIYVIFVWLLKQTLPTGFL
jgi:putative tricarboxylic transport membrane protein